MNTARAFLSAAMSGMVAFTSVAVSAATPPAPSTPSSAKQTAGPSLMDCSKTEYKAWCEQNNQAIETCKDKTGAARDACLEANMPQRQRPQRTEKRAKDCSQATDRQACERTAKAWEACRTKTGAERRTCMQEATSGKKSGSPKNKAAGAPDKG